MEEFSEQILEDLKKYHLQEAERIEQSLKERKLGKYSESQDAEEQNTSASRQRPLHISLSSPWSQRQNGTQDHQRRYIKRCTRTQSLVQEDTPQDLDTSRDKKNKTHTRNQFSRNNQPPPFPKGLTQRHIRGFVRPTFSLMNLNTIEESPGQLSLFPTFKKRAGTLDLGREFEIIMCAYYALKLVISDEVVDFKMSSNNADAENFDDIAITVTFANGRSRGYIFQLKYKEHKKIYVSDLKSQGSKADFGLKNYIESISKMNLDEDTICILLTNCPTVNDISNVNQWHAFKLAQCTQIEFHHFFANSAPNSQNEILEITAENLKQGFFFFTSQMNVKQTEEKINTLLKSLLQSDIVAAYITYIRDWWLSKFFLTKHDVIAKISELSLSPYLISLTDKKCNEKTDNLKQVILSFPLTIISDCKKTIVGDIWKIKQSWINNEFGKAESKYGLKQDQQNTTLWYLRKFPLIVKVDDVNKEIIKCVMNFLRKSLEDQRIVLIGKATRTDFPEWDSFENLRDVIDKCGENEHCKTILQEFKVSHHEIENITLEELVSFEKEAAKFIGAGALLQMTQQDSLHIGNQKIKEELSRTHIPRSVSPILVKKEEIFNCYKSSPNTILVVNCDQNFADTLSKNKDVNMMELSDYLYGTSEEEGPNLILKSIKIKCTNREFETVCKKSNTPNVYLLQQFNDEYCTLIFRKGRKFRSESSSIEETVREGEIFQVYNNNLHVFCAPPGMGKSTLMKVLHNNCPRLSVYIRLIDHNPLLEEQPDFEAILVRFLQVDEAGNELCKKLVKYFWKNQKLYMFLDGLDEINSHRLECILNFVKDACSQGGIIWLSSRENLRERICRTFNVVPIDIKELDKEEQKAYIHCKLKERYKPDEIERITGAMSSSADLNNSQMLLGIPLQLHIITEMFLQSKQVYEDLEQKNLFVLTQMYKIYFEGKVGFAYSKVVDNKQTPQLGYLKFVLQSYELPALLTCLHKEDFERLHVDVKETEELLSEIEKEGDKNGIIRSFNENDQVIFEHQTYAEYFACVWFKRNPKKFRKLGNKIFKKEYENLRRIFDLMLAENNSLYLAIIYEDGTNFANHLEDPSSECDESGRTAFHLAFSYGQKYPPRVENKQNYLRHLRTLSREKAHYMELVKTLLKNNKVSEKNDDIFGLDCVSYALQLGCLYPIEEILATRSLAFSKLEEPLKKCFDEMALAYCSTQFGYSNLLSELVKSHVVAEAKEELVEIAMKGCDGDVFTPPRDGNIAVVQILIENDAISSTKMDEFLKEACENKLFDMLEILTKNKAKCTNGNQILHHLVERCPETYCDEIVKTIEKFQIDVNVPNNNGMTALHKAAGSADLKIVEALMEKGADPNIVDHDGRNALHHASSNSRLEVVELFLNKGLSVDLPGKDGATALHLASEKGKIENVRLFLAKGADLNLVDNGKNNALHYASRSKITNQHVIKLLVDEGLSVNEQNQIGQTPLHLACKGSNLGNLNILLEQNPDLNVEDKDGNNLLNYALKLPSAHCKDIMKLLKPKNFRINRKNRNGFAPIHFAYRRGNFAIADSLKEIGANDNLNARFKNGETLLHWACKRAKYVIAMELLKRGADANSLDDNNRNALYYSLNRGYRAFLVHRMIKHDLNLKTRYQNGQTLLHLACFNCDTQTARELCEKGVDVNIIDDDKQSPLDFVLRSLSKIEKSVKKWLGNKHNSDIDAQHKHDSNKVQAGCVKCYYKVLKSLTEVAAGTEIADLVRQKMSMFVNDDKVIDIFLKDVVSTSSGNSAIHIVARLFIFKMINYLRNNGLKINNIPVSNQNEWNYPEIGELLDNIVNYKETPPGDGKHSKSTQGNLALQSKPVSIGLSAKDEQLYEKTTSQCTYDDVKPAGYSVGEKEQELPPHYVPRKITSTVFDLLAILNFTKDKENIVIVNFNGRLGEVEEKIHNEGITLVEIAQYIGNQKSFIGKSVVLFTNELNPEKQFEIIRTEEAEKRIHLFKMTSEENFILIKSTSNLKCENSHMKTFSQEDIHGVFDGTLNVLVAEAGTGKSFLMKYLLFMCPDNFRTIYADFFTQQHTSEKVLEHFLRVDKDETFFSKEEKQLVFFLDGLDELPRKSVENVIETIDSLTRLEHRVWVSCRPNLEKLFSAKFHLFCLHILEFSKEEQKMYLKKRLESDYGREEIDDIFDKIATTENAKFFSIPLQLYIHTEILKKERKHYPNVLPELFDLTKRYEYFFDIRFQLSLSKCKYEPNFPFLPTLTDHLEKYEVAALQSLLDEETFENLQIDCLRHRAFLKKLEEVGDSLHIVTRVEAGKAIFEHRAYAEYFAAVWFKYNPGKREFLKNYERLSFMLNMISD